MSIHATSTEVYSGKNLFDWNHIAKSGATFGTNNNNGTVEIDTYGIHYKNPTSADQYFTVNGYGAVEPDAASVMRMYNLSPNTSYTISYTATNYSQVFIRFFNLGGGIVSTLSSSITAAGRVSFSFTVPASAYGYQIRVDNEAYGRGLPSLDNDISSIQIEAGSVATDYEPYVGGVPSPLVSDVSHVSTSKNMLNMQSNSNGEYYGTTSQQTYSGKNLMVYPYSTRDPFTNGITFTSNSDGTVVLNGQNNNAGNSVFFFYSSSPGTFTLPAGTYYFLRPSDTAIQLVAYDGTTYWSFNSGNNYSRTFSSSITFQDVYVQVPRGNTTVFNNLKIYPMLSTSPNQTQDDYEPYVGGIPSPNPDYPQEIVTGKLASKNIFEAPSSPAEVWQGDYTKITANSLKVKSTVNHPSSTAYARVNITGLTPNTDYYFSYNYARTGGSVSGPTVGGIATRIDGGAISSVTVGGRKINTGPGTYIRFYFYVGQNTSITTSDEVTFSDIQLEKGSRATEFEPYFTPIELAQKDSYQDKVYKTNSGWMLRKEMGRTDLATETWTRGGVGTGGAIYMVSSSISNIKYVPNNQTLGSGLAEKYIMRIGSGLSGNSAINQIAIDVTRVGVNVGFTEVTPSGLFYYALATPNDTAITDSATIAWLNKYDTDSLPHHKYVNTRRTTYVGASGLASAIDLYDGSYASTLPTYSTANDHNLTTANGGTYTVSLQNISASIVSGTVTFSVFTNQRKIDFSWNGSATSTNVSVSLQANEYIKSIYAYIPQDADAGITLSQQLESGSLTDFEPYYNIVKIYAGDDLVFEDTFLTD